MKVQRWTGCRREVHGQDGVSLCLLSMGSQVFFSDSTIFVACFCFVFLFCFVLFCFVFLLFLQMNGPGNLLASENFLGITSQPRNDFGNFFGSVIAKPFSSGTPRHPLEGTHELRQACQICFVKSGQHTKPAGNRFEP